MRRFYDVTLPFSPRLPAWPGEPKPVVERLKRMADGAESNVTRIDAAVHFGTHMDAPVHFLEDGAGIEALPVEALVGPALVAHLPEADVIAAADVAALDWPSGTERVLFKTRNSALWDDLDHPFATDYVAVAADGARALVERKVRLVGVDYLSVEPFVNDNFATHRTLLGAGVVIVEGLDLRRVPPGVYEMACLPMKIVGADGAPTRVVLWRDD